ncbi:hypothetical protein GOP47_0018123 [Adiantum capillus-veneris]|uniref:PPM-type phosphatase domain-containing protein n=1 Tax=Adiantum capillus-veneris TaxID=13818 RepID=A0A9D4UGR9_ADICA|nr:hypothetical protein GOP47_0018123 [Adiantum capillus-veneris]
MEPTAKRVRSDSALEGAVRIDGVSTTASGSNLLARSCDEAKCEADTHAPESAWVPIEADAAEDKGCRHTMEDAWVLLPDASLDHPGRLRSAHFAIFDGHGGREAADFARTHLHSNVVSAGLPRELLNVKAAKRAITNGFKVTDEALLRESLADGWQDGATAVCVWILGNTVFIANVGDARAVLARVANTDDKGEQKGNCAIEIPAQGETLKGVTITREHKAIFPLERARIEKAGGYVGENGRLLGRLEVSRAFGDRQFKKVGVSAVPDVNSFEITEKERFIILGCDGLWGVFGPSDAVEFVNNQLKEGASVGIACRRLIREAIRERKCKDNCTAVLIVFKHV